MCFQVITRAPCTEAWMLLEAIRTTGIDNLTDSDNKPYLERRGIKFNIPLDLRTRVILIPAMPHSKTSPMFGTNHFGLLILMKWL